MQLYVISESKLQEGLVWVQYGTFTQPFGICLFLTKLLAELCLKVAPEWTHNKIITLVFAPIQIIADDNSESIDS